MNKFTLIAWLTGFTRGALLPFRATAEFARRPRCWLYQLLPLLLGVLLYLCGAILFYYYVVPWLEQLLPKPDEEWHSVLFYSLVWLIRLTAALFLLTMFIFTFTGMFLFIAAPFADQLVTIFEKDKYGFAFECRTWKEFWHYNWNSTISSARISLKILGWSCLLIPASLLLPGPGFLLPAVVIGYYFGISMLIYAACHRRVKYNDFLKELRHARPEIVGMGMVFYILMLIPFGAIFCLPIAVIAGTMLYHEIVIPADKN